MKGQDIWSISIPLSRKLKHTHKPKHPQGCVCVCGNVKRFSSTHQSCGASWSTCYMQTLLRPTEKHTALLCTAFFVQSALTAPADSRLLQMEITFTSSSRHARPPKPRRVWHSAPKPPTAAPIWLAFTPIHGLAVCTVYKIKKKKFLQGRGIAQSEREMNSSGLVTSTQTPWDIRPIFHQLQSSKWSIKDVKTHPIHRFGDCSTKSICNLRPVGREHWIDWFWPFPWQCLLYTFSAK